MVPFSLKLEVKDANRNSTGHFSKVYGTSHLSIRISLAFEASVPPLLSVQRDPKSGSWLPPRGVFSKDATCQCPYLLHDSSTSLLLGQLCWPLPPLLESRLLPFSIGTGVFAGLCPWDSHSLEAGVTGEEVLRSFTLFCGLKSISSLCHCLQLQAGWPVHPRMCKETYFWGS